MNCNDPKLDPLYFFLFLLMFYTVYFKMCTRNFANDYDYLTLLRTEEYVSKISEASMQVIFKRQNIFGEV